MHWMKHVGWANKGLCNKLGWRKTSQITWAKLHVLQGYSKSNVDEQLIMRRLGTEAMLFDVIDNLPYNMT